ncbi:MAG: diphosphate--fructose-6-phosphate 1-phosphotransferase [Bacillota bacterium]
MRKNVLVAQSGGPSPVINASLQGVIEVCLSYPDHMKNVYAAWHGIEGVLKEEIIDMSSQPAEELKRLKNTPAAGAIGTCRYKLGENQENDFNRIIDVMRAHNIGYFFYIGGNDSMDTADKISRLAREKGLELVVVGVPKTIDNDLGDDKFTIIDHTPGYGSAARYWAHHIQNVNEENRGMCGSEAVAVLQAMGRKSGYITAAARLADPQREIPLQLYMAESGHNLETLAENVNRELLRSGRVIVVVNEGFNVGSLGEARDAFGHIEYGASKTSASQVVVNYLNEHGIKARGQATGQLPGVLQRSASMHMSPVDRQEAYEVGMKAVRIAIEDGTGWMATILRAPGSEYRVYYDKVRLDVVANSERFLPREWLSGDGIDVTDDFINYAMPLIQGGWPEIELENGLQRFARIDIRFIEKKLPDYIPQNFQRAK